MPKMFQCYGMGQALIPVLPPPIKFENAPTSNNDTYEPGQLVYTGSAGSYAFYIYAGAGVWNQISDSDGSIQSVLGTANQITASTTAGVATLSLPAAITAPGSLTTTTTLASTTTMTAGTGLTVTSGGATITAGDVTVTNGNVLINGNGKYLQVQGGAATDFIGSATLTLGITSSIANTDITTSDRIFVERTAANASTALGVFTVNISAGVGFTIEALKPADATRETADVSTVSYFIVRQV